MVAGPLLKFLWEHAWETGATAAAVIVGAVVFLGNVSKFTGYTVKSYVDYRKAKKTEKPREVKAVEPKLAGKPVHVPIISAQSEDRPKRPPKPTRERPTSGPVWHSVFIGGDFRSQPVLFPCRWEWSDNTIVFLQARCPVCSDPLNLTVDPEIPPPPSYTRMDCPKCHWWGRSEGSPIETRQKLTQTVYYGCQQQGLL